MVLLRAKNLLKSYLLTRRSYKFFIRDWVALSDLQRAADAMGTLRFSRNLAPILMQRPRGNRIVVLAPHPDDEVMGPGGTLIRAARSGADIATVYLTDGPREKREALRNEARKAAAFIGYKTQFLGFPLNAIPISRESLAALAAAISRHRPDTLFLPFLVDDHDDHRRASHMLLEARKQGLISDDLEIWAYQGYTSLPSNVVVDITDVHEDKRLAIEAYESQKEIRNWPHYVLGLNAFNSRFLKKGSIASYAESFFVLPISDYVALCEVYFRDDSAECYYFQSYQESTGDTRRAGST